MCVGVVVGEFVFNVRGIVTSVVLLVGVAGCVVVFTFAFSFPVLSRP